MQTARHATGSSRRAPSRSLFASLRAAGRRALACPAAARGRQGPCLRRIALPQAVPAPGPGFGRGICCSLGRGLGSIPWGGDMRPAGHSAAAGARLCPDAGGSCLRCPPPAASPVCRRPPPHGFDSRAAPGREAHRITVHAIKGCVRLRIRPLGLGLQW